MNQEWLGKVLFCFVLVVGCRFCFSCYSGAITLLTASSKAIYKNAITKCSCKSLCSLNGCFVQLLVGKHDLLRSLPCVRLSPKDVKTFTLWWFILFHGKIALWFSCTGQLPPWIDIRNYLLSCCMIVILFFLCR